MALAVMLLLTAILLPMGIFLAAAARTELQVAHNNRLGKQALAIAEGGIQHVFSLLKNDPNGFDDELDGTGTERAGTGGVLATLGVPKQVQGGEYRFVAFGGQGDPDGYYVRIEDNYDEIPHNPAADVDRRVKIISRGRFNGAERVIEVLVWNPPGFGGLFGKQRLDLGGGTTTDSYDSSLGSYDPDHPGNDGDVGSNGDIILNGNPIQVGGDARAGGTVSQGQATITGILVNNAPLRHFPPVQPCGPPYSNGSGITGGHYDSGTGELTASSHDSIQFANGTYCLKSIEMTGHSTLTVTGRVVIKLTGNGRFTGNGIVNTTQKAENLRILSSGSELKVSGNSAIHMSIYAPDAQVDLSGSSEFYGGAVGNELDGTGGTRFHVDRGLGDGKFKILNWHEVK